MRKKINVSVIILNHESNKETLKCIESVKRSKCKFNFEIIVLDNSRVKRLDSKMKLSRAYARDIFSSRFVESEIPPKRESLRVYPRTDALGISRRRIKEGNVRYIELPENRGYGAGNNVGIQNSVGKYLLILNADCVLSPNTISILSNFLDKNKDAGAVSPNLKDRKGRIFSQLGSRRLTPLSAIFSLSFLNKLFPKNPISKNYYMNDANLSELREANAIPGSAFLIRRELMLKIGGFDEKFFLYFEESDLGRRINEAGYKLFITPKTEVEHSWGAHLGDKQHQKYFSESRFYYFKKYYGIFAALIVEFFCRMSFYDLIFALIFSAGIFLRFYKLLEAFNFDSEVADNLLEMKNYIISGQIPLIGPPTSHPWLAFPPLFYWFYMPILKFTSYEPIYHFIVGGIVNSGAILLYYLFTKKYWGRSTALVSSIIMSFSPYLIMFSFSARFYTYILPISAVFMTLLLKLSDNRKYLFWIFMTLSVMFSFHFTPIILIPVIGYVFLKSFRPKFPDVTKSILGLMIPLSPLLYFDLGNGFPMLSKLILWIPYRLLGFTGMSKSGGVGYSLSSSVDSARSFFQELFGISNVYLTFIFISLAAIGIYFSRKNISSYSKILLLTIIFSMISLFLHGSAPLHYYLIVAPLIVIAVSIGFVELRARSKYFGILMIILLIYFSLTSIFDTIKVRRELSEVSLVSGSYVPFSLIEKVSAYVVRDADGSPFVLRRIGVGDEYGADFAHKYQYLMWKYGSEPVEVGDLKIREIPTGIEYTIIEDRDYKEDPGVEVFNYKNITIVSKKQ